MQPATIRRLLVFGVCLVGIGCLYLLPSVAGSPGGLGSSPVQRDLPTARTSRETPDSATLPPSPTTSEIGETTAPTATSTIRTGGDDPGSDGRSTTRPTHRPAATAGDPGADRTPPGAVGRLTVVRVDTERLTVTWPEASDDIAVVGYRVWLNGFLVLATQQPRASLRWFNDSNTHVVQVRALDAVGNEGLASPTLLVVRPSPTPEPTTPSPSTPPTDKPTQSPNPTDGGDQTPGPNPAPSAPVGNDAPAGAEGPGAADQEVSS